MDGNDYPYIKNINGKWAIFWGPLDKDIFYCDSYSKARFYLKNKHLYLQELLTREINTLYDDIYTSRLRDDCYRYYLDD